MTYFAGQAVRRVGVVATLLLMVAPMPSIARAAAREPQTFRCESGKDFIVEFSARGVKVVLPDRRIAMRAKSFHLAERYVSKSGTLIIDQDFASLVLDDDMSFGACALAAKPQKSVDPQR